jgi:hypothetical protein
MNIIDCCHNSTPVLAVIDRHYGDYTFSQVLSPTLFPFASRSQPSPAKAIDFSPNADPLADRAGEFAKWAIAFAVMADPFAVNSVGFAAFVLGKGDRVGVRSIFGEMGDRSRWLER